MTFQLQDKDDGSSSGALVEGDGDTESGLTFPTTGDIQEEILTQQRNLEDGDSDLGPVDLEKLKSTLPSNASHEQEKPLPPKDDEHTELAVATAIPYDSDEDLDGGKKAHIKQVAILKSEYNPEEEEIIPFYRQHPIIAWGACFLLFSLIVLLAVLFAPRKTKIVTSLVTEAPTFSPTEITRESIITNLLAKEFSPSVVVKGTAYSKAAEWIIHQDILQLEMGRDLDRLKQRFALAVFYFSTTQNGPWRSCNAPDPAENSNKTCTYLAPTSIDGGFTIEYKEVPSMVRWLSNSNECTWRGVVCDSNGVVAKIDVNGQGIRGNLERILAGNADSEDKNSVANILSKAFPALQVLYLSQNELTGNLPVSLSDFTNLLALDLYGNSLTGEIPALYFDKLTSLQQLNLGNNLLTGEVDTRIGQLSELRGLHLVRNNLQGQLPSEIGKLSTMLYMMRLDGNDFSGQLPSELGRLSGLVQLEYQDNSFTGTIPTELGQLTAIQYLKLNGNQLSGTIPVALCNLERLQLLSLDNNALSGPLPTSELSQLQRLVIFQVNNNQLTGPIPSELGNLQSLRAAWLHLNQFTSAVPFEVCERTSIPDAGGLTFLQADCAPIDNPPNACRCCTACCDRLTKICNLAE